MRHACHTVSFGLVAALCLWMGYHEMKPEQLARANPDILFCAVVLITMILIPLGTIWMSGVQQVTLRRPSWRRFSMDWQNDPLQCLFLTRFFIGCLVVGAAFHLQGTSETGFWMFMFFVCLFFGLLIGQFLVYRVYRERIVET